MEIKERERGMHAWEEEGGLKSLQRGCVGGLEDCDDDDDDDDVCLDNRDGRRGL